MLTVPGEGATIAEFFIRNIAALLRYRRPQYHYPTTPGRACNALNGECANHVIRRWEFLEVQQEGYLAAMLATLYNKSAAGCAMAPDAIDSRSAPAFALLLYPVIDLTDDAVTHRGSRTNLTQDNPDLYESLSPWKHVTPNTPPAFIIHGTNDFLVPVKNSLLYFEACLKARVPVEMHLEDIAQHGFGMVQI
jgi:hypothetical protein